MIFLGLFTLGLIAGLSISVIYAMVILGGIE